jgi:hypothetical protein
MKLVRPNFWVYFNPPRSCMVLTVIFWWCFRKYDGLNEAEIYIKES